VILDCDSVGPVVVSDELILDTPPSSPGDREDEFTGPAKDNSPLSDSSSSR